MYLLDSDAARCLCQYELLHELADALGCSLLDFAVLPQLRFQLRLGKPNAMDKLGSAEAIELAELLVAQASEVTVSANSANALLLSNRPDIDAGELILFAALCDDAASTLVTGDKRALVALSAVADPALETLWARLICLEEAIALIIKHVGFEAVSQKIRARPDVNVALSIAFGRSTAAPSPSVLEGLASYVSDVMQSTQGKYHLKQFAVHGACLSCP